MNKVFLTGRLTADPEIKTIGANSSHVCDFSLAVRREYKTEDGPTADFINNLQAWGKTADLICQYCHKGSMVAIEGALSPSSYEDKQGNKKTITRINVSSVEFLDSKNGNGQNAGEQQPANYAQPEIPDDGGNTDAENDLPF